MADALRTRSGDNEEAGQAAGLTRRSVLALFLALTGSGAAAGGAMNESSVGKVVTTVTQAVVVGSNGIVVTDATGNTIANANATVSDDRTEFKVGTSVKQGDQYQLRVDLANRADNAIWARLRLSAPEAAGIQITNDPTSSTRIQRVSGEEWQIRVPRAVDDGTIDLHITVAFTDDITPGFHTISAALHPDSESSGELGDPKGFGGEGFGQGGYGH